MERPELTKKSKYWIPRHRYYELKHFCLQYPSWKKHLAIISDWPNCIPKEVRIKQNTPKRPTENIILKKNELQGKIDMIERIAKDVDPVIAPYLIKGVTEGFSYDNLRPRTDIPCNREEYYALYRKFFWILSEERH